MRIIAHLDMDAFFAAIEERDRPWLAGRPIVVGSDPEGGQGRGIVATANYPARKYGIYSATPITRAWRLGEEARARGESQVVFITSSGGKYNTVSKHIMKIIASYAPYIEKRSIDEAYFDLSHLGSFKKAIALVKKIKTEIKRKEKLTCSIGVAPNKMIAKISSDFKKPDGITIVREEEVMKFLAPLPVRVIPGIGPKAGEKLRQNGIHTIADMRRLSKGKLMALLGTYGAVYFNKARGIDSSLLSPPREVKSIGKNETFRNDTLDMKYLFECIKSLSSRVHERFLKKKFNSFHTVVLTVRFSDFETMTRSYTLPCAVDSLGKLHFHMTRLLMPFLDKRDNPHMKKIRLLGVRIEKLH